MARARALRAGHARPPRRTGARRSRDLDRSARPVTGTLLRGGIRPLLFPRSVAVVGASDRDAQGRRVISSRSLRGGVPTWFVNPNRPTVLGRECHPLAHRAAGDAGVRLPAGRPHARRGGLRGRDRGRRARGRAARARRRGGSRGPRRRGAHRRASGRGRHRGGGPELHGRRDPGRPVAVDRRGRRPEAFLPGHVAVRRAFRLDRRGLLAAGPRVGFRTVISAGGELSRDLADFVAYLAADDGTRAIGLFAETIRRPDGVRGRRSAQAPRPASPWCASRSDARRRGPGRARALRRGRGLGARVLGAAAPPRRDRGRRLPRAARDARACSGAQRWPRGLRIAGVSESGGECALLADHGERAGIPFAPFDDALRARLIAAFPNYTLPENPLDCWAIDDAESSTRGASRCCATRASTTCCWPRSTSRSTAARTTRSGAR